ncbi:MAG: isoprenyl transferase [Sedimentisphaerales bacterium]|nr:isoprenyl transferase [Sedimentisphaerales bacterium]
MNKNAETRFNQTAARLGIKPGDMPRHIAIIMDGNGRWAQNRGLPRYEGHRQGGKTAEKISQCCVDFGIEVLTLYSFSIENWKRPQEEIDVLMHLYAEYLDKMRPTLMEDNVKLVHLGRMERLPQIVKKALTDTAKATEKNTGMVFALALNYGSRVEIIDATREIARKHKAGRLSLEDIDEKCIDSHLYTAGLPDPDLLIRTANEMRVSNFLLWQISYCEFYVTETLWPDFEKADLEKAILAYAKRTRRFGAVVDSKDG